MTSQRICSNHTHASAVAISLKKVSCGNVTPAIVRILIRKRRLQAGNENANCLIYATQSATLSGSNNKPKGVADAKQPISASNNTPTDNANTHPTFSGGKDGTPTVLGESIIGIAHGGVKWTGKT